MGQLTVTKKVTLQISGVLCVDQDGKFLGEYFPGQTVYVEHRPVPEDAIELPADTPSPPNSRCSWNGKEWEDPGPSEKDLEREAARQASAKAREAAIAKIETLGLTVDDIKSLL